MTLIAANVAFFYYNYPNGRLFLGDAGAYFMGFVLSSLIIMFVCKQPSISAWYGFTLMIYPITEALFSIYRKKIVRKSSPFMPDGLHLHMLIYKRCLPKFKHLPKKQAQLKRNMLTSPILWLLSLVGIVPATLFAQNTLYLQISCLLFVLIYLLFYTLIVRFKIQRFLLLFRQTFKLNGN
jgi:UDP-N-acetylmuramyl pentapeptide phosphotransferase/UDP-N-acetylglucosamine-1-phosphate transferase